MLRTDGFIIEDFRLGKGRLHRIDFPCRLPGSGSRLGKRSGAGQEGERGLSRSRRALQVDWAVAGQSGAT